VPASEDTTLYELNPNSNLGSATLGAGAISQPFSGSPARMRALIRFDLSELPAGATITSAEVTVTVVDHLPSGTPPGSTFELHRALKDWGEGNKIGTLGGLAETGEATWLAPKHPGPAWTDSGASGADDTAATISSSIPVNALGSYTFPSTTDLVADVQAWLVNPTSNFGWLMKSDSEELRQTARRFGNSERAAGGPTLTISYTLPATELKIQQFELRPAGMFLSWTGGTAPYRVERADDILGPWTAVTPASNETQATAPADLPTAFYRVVSPAP
jgi:hypothetical protein